jgi:hypothetical protein
MVPTVNKRLLFAVSRRRLVAHFEGFAAEVNSLCHSYVRHYPLPKAHTVC